jgi:4-hydroxy-4-methyl-2-oxoglutarate aldolase
MPDNRWADLAHRFSAIYTGAITDVLDKHGFLRQTLPPELAPLSPGMRTAGPAWPIEGRPEPGIGYDASIRRILEMLGAVPEHHVAVYQTHDRSSAHLGELSVTSLKARGCAGAVIDGGCRDVEYILKEDFPVFARHTTPEDCVPRWRLVDYNVSVTIGGVRVSPGDYVVADLDGIVVIPASVLDDVLQEAEAVVSTESDIRTAVRQGVLPLDAYEQYGTF